MNTSNSTNEFLLLFRGSDWTRSSSPEQIQQALEQFRAWFERLTAEGTLKAGQPLLPEARVVSGRGGSTVTDGPFAESKEAVGGYFLIRAESFEEAVAVARQCPALAYGVAVEVRQTAVECPLQARLKAEAAAAAREPELAAV